MSCSLEQLTGISGRFQYLSNYNLLHMANIIMDIILFEKGGYLSDTAFKECTHLFP